MLPYIAIHQNPYPVFLPIGFDFLNKSLSLRQVGAK